jgi:hypothetical protein
MQLLYIILICVALYLYFTYGKKENFETSATVSIKTIDGKYLTQAANKALVETSDASNKSVFTVMKFSDTIIALSLDGYYMAACFGDKCTDRIFVNNYNPYAANAKLTLIKNDDGTFYVQFFDGKFMTTDVGGAITKTTNKQKALKVFIN